MNLVEFSPLFYESSARGTWCVHLFWSSNAGKLTRGICMLLINNTHFSN